jgi:nucleoside-diphosphate-sugar epimerase
MNVLLIGHGYIGSVLSAALENAVAPITVCDQSLEKLRGVKRAVHCPYQALTIGDLALFDVILWFAGHSSVPQAVNDPAGAAANNCFDLFTLAQRKRADTRLIYASTASIYSTLHVDPDNTPAELDETETRLNPVNPYDASKIAFDALAACFLKNVTGLRLGTVCGFSPFLRRELVFNAMNLTAIKEGHVSLANPHAHRTLLFLEDLAFFAAALIRAETPLPRILNVGSCNISIGDLAAAVASHHGVPVHTIAGGPTYSFRTDSRRIRGLAGTPPKMSLSDRCAQFSAGLAAAGAL